MLLRQFARRRPQPLPVLVVDDDRAARQSMKWLLESDGYKVVTAADGTQALHKLRHGLAPCLILLDLGMPGMDGFEFRQEQLQNPVLAAIPVIVYAASGEIGDEPEWHGVTFLEKPFDADAVLELVARHCHPEGERGARRARA